MFTDSILARLPPSQRAPLGAVQLSVPAELPGEYRLDPGFVLHAVFDPRRRTVVVPLRTIRWLDEYAGVTAETERRGCEARLTLRLLYAGMLAASPPDGGRQPGPFAAFGMGPRIYDAPGVKDLSNKLLNSTLFFLLAHELGHLAHGHGPARGLASQRQEQQADAYAMDVMAQVGINPLGIVMLFTALAMMEGDQSTHPMSGSRVDAAARAIEIRPLAFVDRSERDPQAWVPVLLEAARQAREAMPLADDPAQREAVLRTGRGASFAQLPELTRRMCPA